MPITFIGTNQDIGSGAATPRAVAEPGGSAQNDFFLGVALLEGANIPGLPSGYTSLGGLTVGTTLSMSVGWAIRGASALDDNFTWLGGGTPYRECFVFVWRGVSTSSPIDVASALTEAPAGILANKGANRAASDIDPPAITVVTPNALAIAIGQHWDGVVDAAGWTPPTGYTIRSRNATGDDVMVAEKQLVSAGVEDPDEFFDNGNTGDNITVYMTLALREDVPSFQFSTTVPNLRSRRPAIFSPGLGR